MQNKLTEGDPLKLILKFMIPLWLGNIIQQLYNTCDTILVGRYVGADSLAAVGSTGTIMFLFLGLANGMATGYTILTSQRFGDDDEEGTKLSVTNGLFLCLCMIVFMTSLSFVVLKPLLRLMNTPADIFTDAYTYISTICIGAFAMVSNCYLSALLRSVGNSKAPLFFMFASAVLNIGLDLLFIINFKWGVAGAAWATVISQVFASVGSLIYILLRVPVLVPKRKHFKINSRTIRSQLSLGVPMALQNGITASGTLVAQSAINSFGTIAVTAMTASNKLQDLLTQGHFSMGLTMSSYAGQNYGKGDTERIKAGTKAAMKIMAIYSILAMVLIVIILKPGLALFLDEGADVNVYYPMARINIYEAMTCYIGLGMIFVYRSTMQACDRGMRAMTMGIAEFFSRLIVSLISIGTGVFYICCAANPFAWFVAGIYGMIMYKRMMVIIEKQSKLRPNADDAK